MICSLPWSGEEDHAAAAEGYNDQDVSTVHATAETITCLTAVVLDETRLHQRAAAQSGEDHVHDHDDDFHDARSDDEGENPESPDRRSGSRRVVARTSRLSIPGLVSNVVLKLRSRFSGNTA